MRGLNYAASFVEAQGKVGHGPPEAKLNKCSQDPGKSMQVETLIREKLIEAFSPDQLLIENESRKHAHHVAMKGIPQTGETHFNITIVSTRFAGHSRIERHRMVNQVLAAELAGPVHALSIRARTPDEIANG